MWQKHFTMHLGVHSHISKLDSRPSVSVTGHSISWCSFHVCPINHHLLVTDMEISIIAQAEITLNVCGYVEDGFNICKLFQIVPSVLGEISAMIKRNKWNFKEMFCFVLVFLKEESTGLLQAFLTLAEKEGISLN